MGDERIRRLTDEQLTHATYCEECSDDGFGHRLRALYAERDRRKSLRRQPTESDE